MNKFQFLRQAVLPIFLLMGLFLFEICISSCARRAAPSGGSKDTLSPKMDTSYPPNNSTHFNSHEVTLVFNEYLQLKGAGQQISISPPLKNDLEIELVKGKMVRLSWKEDTLLTNTTYIISFGTAITDYTENNVNENFKYVFSTGDFIDSLKFGGSIENSLSDEPSQKLMLALYYLDSNHVNLDSLPYKKLPTYYAYTNEQGKFELSNLKYGDYWVMAFDDALGQFKASASSKEIAFWGDTLRLNTDTKPLKLKSFSPAPKKRFYGGQHISFGQIELAYNHPIKYSKIYFLATADSTPKIQHIASSKNNDTIHLWFDENKQDSVVLIIEKENEKTDTSTIRITEHEKENVILRNKHNAVIYNEKIEIECSFPITNITDSLALIYTEKDTSFVQLTLSENNPFLIEVNLKKRTPKFWVYIPKKTIEITSGQSNDSTLFSYQTLTVEDLGTMEFGVQADSSVNRVLQIFNPENEMIIEIPFLGSCKTLLKHKRPGEYTAQIIVDDNNDGKWTNGSYLERRQAERILKHKTPLELRANWEIYLDWIIESD